MLEDLNRDGILLSSQRGASPDKEDWDGMDNVLVSVNLVHCEQPICLNNTHRKRSTHMQSGGDRG